jgi:tartrate-resistant acid phosphatase type 5
VTSPFDNPDKAHGLSRRRFLQQTFAYSALLALGSVPGALASVAADLGSADLLMIGDWGYDDNHAAQAAVASAMRQYVDQNHLRVGALLLLGDNWYGALEGGVESSRWQTQFEQMYPASVFDCLAYAILGNHDYQNWPESKVDAQLAYARKRGTRWTMPSRWYRFEFPAKNPLVTFLALDSNMPFADGRATHGVNFTMTDGQRLEQLAWLESELRRPRTTRYLVVLGHHPVYSDGMHGDHPVLVRDWDPLFRKYNVHGYLAGHDHDMQHLEFENHPTSFFLSGGGGAALYDLTIDPATRGPYGQKVYGFSHLSVSSKRMIFRHLDEKGRSLHAFLKTPDYKVEVLRGSD